MSDTESNLKDELQEALRNAVEDFANEHSGASEAVDAWLKGIHGKK